MQIFWSVFAILFVFGLVVCFHELGHFLIAKWCGIGVEQFSFGFPPRAFGKKIGETDYCVSWLPLGGYVRLQGMADDERAALPPDAPPEKPRDPARDFDRHPRWQRVLVMSGGVLFNFILTLGLLVAVQHGRHLESLAERAPVVVVDVEPGGPAEKAGLRPLDVITRVAGDPISGSKEAEMLILTSNRGGYDLQVTRDGRSLSLHLVPELKKVKGETYGYLGLYLPGTEGMWVIDAPKPGTPAAAAGLRKGDILATFDGKALHDFKDKALPITDKAVTSITLGVIRDGRMESVVMSRAPGSLWGLQNGQEVYNSLGRAWSLALKEFRGESTALVRLIRKLTGRETSLRSLSGPIGIIKLIGSAQFTSPAGYAAQLLQFAIFISLQLGIMNLLPIPALDGGHILILTLESLSRREFPRKTKERIVIAGFWFLLSLVAVLTVSDVLKLFDR